MHNAWVAGGTALKSGLRVVAAATLGLSAAIIPAFFSGAQAATSATVYNLLTDAAYEALGGSTYIAQSFTTGASAADLTSVQVWLRNNGGSTASYWITLNASSSGAPGTAIATLASGTSLVPYYDGQPTVTPSGTVSLTANTRYFVVVSGTSGVYWKGGTSAPATSVSPAPTFVTYKSTDSGSSWPSQITGSYRDAVVLLSETATAPGAPTAVTATPANTSASVSWTAPADNGSAITNYTVTSSPDGQTCSTATTACTVGSLTNGTSYTFTVVATNSIGPGSASSASSPVTPRTVPGVPTAVTASASDGSALVSWTAPSSNGGSVITSYTATSSPGGRTCTTATTTCTVSGLSNGTPYTFAVTATNTAGSGSASAASTAVTPTASGGGGGGGGGSTSTPTPTPTPTPTSIPTSEPPSSVIAPAPAPVASTVTRRPGTAPIAPAPTSGSPAASPDPTPSSSATAIATPSPSTTTSASAAATSSPSPATTPSRSPQGINALPPAGQSILTDDAPFGAQVDMSVDIQVGEPVSGRTIAVQASGLEPGSEVTLRVYSDPRTLGTAVADALGTATIRATMPSDLDAGTHTLEAVGTGPSGQPVQSVGGFTMSDTQVVTALASPAQVATPVAPDSAEVRRAIDAGKPLYSVALYPAVIATVALSGAAVAGLAGAGGLTSNAPGGTGSSGGGSSSRGKLANVVTKKLKALKAGEPGPGDRSRTWAMPGTATTDTWISAVPKQVGHYTALLPRVLVDGSWARAMFGSMGFLLWVAGLVLGLVSATSVGCQALPPALPLIVAIVVLGVLDAAAGMMAWLVIVIAAAITGHLTSLAELRTVLGLFVIFASIPLLAHVIRPLRRKVATSRMERFDQIADYVMPPVFLAFAAASMFKALNGLSGLQVVDKSDILAIQISVALAFLVRRGLEDVATYAYPQRSAAVQPEKLVSPGVRLQWVSVVMRVIVFVIVAAPFFGLGWITWIAALLTAIPMALKIYEDQLPNLAWLNKWYPRGVFRFALLLVICLYVSAWLLGHHSTDDQVRQTYNLILLPGILAGLIELVGREGWEWPDTWSKRFIGIAIWAFAVLLVTGAISLT